MHTEEVDSLLSKFKQLWTTGFDAHLDLHAHAGQAWVNLHVRLGHAQDQGIRSNFNRLRNGPSRQRRREKRANSRREAAGASETVIAEATILSETNETAADAESPQETENDVSEQSNINDFKKYDAIDNESDGISKKSQEEIEVDETTHAEEHYIEIDEHAEHTEHAEHAINTEEVSILNASEMAAQAQEKEISPQNEIPPVILVHATAIIDGSPNESLTNDERNAIVKIVRSKDHLTMNIEHVDYTYLSSRELRSKYKHTVGLTISVKTCNLWEGARSYIWKHLGRDTWTLGNGAEVNLVRIHQK